MATTTTSPLTVAQAIMDAVNAHDLDRLVTLYADTIDERMPDRTLSSPTELRAYMNELFTALPDVHFDVHTIAEAGEEVIVYWTVTGTHDGVFQGIKPTGTKLSVEGFERMTIRDGKLVANRVVFDRTSFGQQLGLLPPDDSPAERAMKATFNARTALKARFSRR
jgi:steroid delta-isomerase-like uncharacterized protein